MFDASALTVDLEGPVAVYVQIHDQIRYAIASGRLKQGDLLPSVRSVSEALHVNPNTVTKAYRDLELLDLVFSRRGVGGKVSGRARQRCEASVKRDVKNSLLAALANCAAAGLGVDGIQAIVDKGLSGNVAK